MSGGDLLFIFAFIVLPTALLVSCLWLYVLLRRGMLLPRRALPADGSVATDAGGETVGHIATAPPPATDAHAPASEREPRAAPVDEAANIVSPSEQTLDLTAWQAQQVALAAQLQADTAGAESAGPAEPARSDLAPPASADPAPAGDDVLAEEAPVVAAGPDDIDERDQTSADDHGDEPPAGKQQDAGPAEPAEPAIERTDEHPVVPPAPPIAAAELLDAAPLNASSAPAASDRPAPPARRKPMRRPAAARPLDELPRPRLNAALFRKGARHPG